MRLATALTADVKEFAKDNGFAEINNILKGSYKDYTVLTNSKINEIEEISSSLAEQCADHARKQLESKYMSMMLMYNWVCVGDAVLRNMRPGERKHCVARFYSDSGFNGDGLYFKDKLITTIN